MVVAKVHPVVAGDGLVIMASTALGARCCEALLDRGVPIAKILSIPREFSISWSRDPVVNVQFADLEVFARRRSIAFSLVGTGKTSDYRAALGPLKPSLLMALGWYFMVPKAIRDLSVAGSVGIHASLLPKDRGGAPLVWAMIRGDKRTGVTLFHLGAGIDDGDIVAQTAFEIGDDDDVAVILKKATSCAVALVVENVPRLLDGTAPREPQDHAAANVLPQRSAEDGVMDWGRLTSKQAYDWVRAQTRPYPGAFSYLDGQKVTIWRAGPAIADRAPALPGTLVTDTGVEVWCAGDSKLQIVEASIDGGPSVGGRDLITAASIRPGSRFSNPDGTS